MPKKGYKQSPEHLEKNRLARIGHKISEETRAKMRESKLGPKNHNFGKTFSEETRKKISIAMSGENNPNTGKPRPEHVKKAIGDAHRGEKNHNYGKHLPDEVKEKIRIATSGERNHNFGKTFSEETKEKIALHHIGKIIPIETRIKMSEAQKGENAKNFGVTLSESTRMKISESRLGDKNPSWNGGTSFAPYCQKFNREFKERVREFFSRKCVECGSPEGEKRLHVHHVNFDKMTCCNGTEPLFVALCHSCHNKTQIDRDYWEEYFTDIINDRYGGKCYFTKEEMRNLKGIGA
jgi:hypothetical protein